MAKYLTFGLVQHIIAFQLVLLLIIFSNIWIMRRARHHLPLRSYPFLSILIPARNEEKNIAQCVLSLLVQDYPEFEVIVLDDESTDNTRKILDELSLQNSKLIIITGKSKPEDQIGKNWACTQLAERAAGDYFLFTDADTVYQPNSLKSLITALKGEKADLLTGFPKQQVHSWGERLLVPFFSWAMISFNPLGIAYRLRLSTLSSAVGQMMFFARDAYFQVGGHAGISGSVVDDLSLVRQIKKFQLRWRAAYIADLISCRMYDNPRQVYSGFVKNLFAAFEYRALPFFFVFGWLFIMFVGPILILVLSLLGLAPLARSSDILTSIALSILIWVLPYHEIKVPWTLGLVYPVTVIANIGVAFQSFRLTVAGKLSWKGRPITRQKWKWM